MKRLTRIISLLLLCCVVCVPAITAKAATQPAQPGGLGVYSQDKSRIAVDFAFDANLPYYSPENPYSFGYEVTVCNLKGKVIAVLDSNSSGAFKMEDSSTVAVILSGSKYTKQGFTFKVRSFVCDENNQPIYSEYSKEKVVIPRANVNKLKATSSSSGKITWTKVKSAKKYNVYLSSNGGKSYKKYGSTKSNSMTIKNMKLSKEYRVYVTAEGVKYKKKTVKPYKAKDKQAGAVRIRIYTKY